MHIFTALRRSTHGAGMCLHQSFARGCTEDEQADGAGVNNGLSKVSVMLGDAREGESGSLLDGWVELFKTIHEGIKGTRVNDSLGEVR